MATKLIEVGFGIKKPDYKNWSALQIKLNKVLSFIFQKSKTVFMIRLVECFVEVGRGKDALAILLAEAGFKNDNSGNHDQILLKVEKQYHNMASPLATIYLKLIFHGLQIFKL